MEQFPDIQAVLDYLTTQQIEAEEAIMPEQLVLADGHEHWYFRLYPGGLGIFGHVWDVDLVIAAERKYYDFNNPWDVAQFNETEAMIRESLANHRVMTDSFSVIVPDGEPGMVHIAAMWPITMETFEEAKRFGWNVLPALQPLVMAMLRELSATMKAYREE